MMPPPVHAPFAGPRPQSLPVLPPGRRLPLRFPEAHHRPDPCPRHRVFGAFVEHFIFKHFHSFAVRRSSSKAEYEIMLLSTRVFYCSSSNTIARQGKSNLRKGGMAAIGQGSHQLTVNILFFFPSFNRSASTSICPS